jgi:glucose/arabinose dehydrogenase
MAPGNKSVRAGYEVIRVPLHQSKDATGEYQDFLTGFVVNNEAVWGRPVGITVAQDGSLLVTDDGSILSGGSATRNLRLPAKWRQANSTSLALGGRTAPVSR